MSSNFGYQFYLTIVDDHTRYVGFYLLINKSDIYSTFIGFKKMVENRFNRASKMLQMDGGGEFTSKLFLYFLLNNAIGHQISYPYTAQQSSVVKRKHRHIV